MSIPALRNLLVNTSVRYSCHSPAYRHHSTFAFQKMSLRPQIDALETALKLDSNVTSIAFQRNAFNKNQIRRILQIIEKKQFYLPACGSVNAHGFGNEMKIFHKPNFEALKAMAPSLSERGAQWGYQMQNIPLNEESIAKLTDHIFEINAHNDVVLTIDNQAKELWRPRMNLMTFELDLSDRSCSLWKSIPNF